jgi:hypothetical protein
LLLHNVKAENAIFTIKVFLAILRYTKRLQQRMSQMTYKEQTATEKTRSGSSSPLSGLALEETQEVNEQEVRSFGAAAGTGVKPSDLSGTGFTYRHDWGDRNHGQRLTLNWNVITANSRVFVAIGEGASGGGKFLGAAKFTLFNVAPANGSVGIWLDIDWTSPLRLYADYLITNP